MSNHEPLSYPVSIPPSAEAVTDVLIEGMAGQVMRHYVVAMGTIPTVSTAGARQLSADIGMSYRVPFLVQTISQCNRTERRYMKLVHETSLEWILNGNTIELYVGCCV